MTRITKFDIREQIKRLTAAGYNIPSSTDLNTLASAMAEHVGPVDAEDLAKAVTQYIDSGARSFPRPGELRTSAIAAARDRGAFEYRAPVGDLNATYRKWEQHNDGPCPVCGARFKLLPHERLTPIRENPETWHRTWGTASRQRHGVMHDAAKHRATGVFWIGPPFLDPDERMESRR